MNLVDLREALSKPDVEEESPAPTEDLQSALSDLQGAYTKVMASYQNANKWLDTIKEDLLMVKGCENFSNYVHELAHTMPVRFDAFGDILHTCNLIIPYPTTEVCSFELSDMYGVFNAIFETLQGVQDSLREFIKATQDTEYHAMACSAEELLVSICQENTPLYKLLKAYDVSKDILKFDNWVGHNYPVKGA